MIHIIGSKCNQSLKCNWIIAKIFIFNNKAYLNFVDGLFNFFVKSLKI